jgi:hypothetical protein
MSRVLADVDTHRGSENGLLSGPTSYVFHERAGTGHHAEANQLVNSGQLLTVRNVRLGLAQTS